MLCKNRRNIAPDIALKYIFATSLNGICITKTQKEIAFLRDLYIDEEWTRRFTDLADKHLDFSKEEKLLYINAGTGNHALVLREKSDKDTEFFATCENEDLLNIARDKAAAVKANIHFSCDTFDNKSFDAVLADASFVRPEDLQNLINIAVRAAKKGGQVAFLIVTSGSFGEIFSYLWEIFFTEDLGEHSAKAEKLISELPTVSDAEKIAENAGLKNIQSHTEREIFEYKNGAEFVNSILVADFLMPVWLESLSEEQKTRVSEKLTQLVDAEDGDLSFRFSVKATLVTGAKS